MKSNEIDHHDLNNKRKNHHHIIKVPASSCMWFKIKTQDMSFVLATWYRQWEHPEIIKQIYTNCVNGEVECMESFQWQINKAKNISSNIIITGDINIDML